MASRITDDLMLRSPSGPAWAKSVDSTQPSSTTSCPPVSSQKGKEAGNFLVKLKEAKTSQRTKGNHVSVRTRVRISRSYIKD